MKKVIALCLVLTLMLGLVACGGAGNSKEESLQVGYAKVNITPSYSMPLSGYSDNENRHSQEVIDYIYTTCIAVTSGETTFLIYTLDNLAAPLTNQKAFRSAIAIATEVPDENIFIGATHSHSCPEYSGQYKTDMANWMVEAAQKAIADQAPATMLAATPKYEGMNFVRHYQNDDGTYVGSNFGHWGNLVRHATEPDSTAVLLKFDRPEDKKDILMVNWQAHPDSGRTIGSYSIAASWVGPLRDKLEELSGLQVAYFTGASGNQNIDSKIESEAHNLGWREYGEKMGELINESLSQLQPVSGTQMKNSRQLVDAPIDHSWDHMLAQAHEVYDLWKSTTKEQGDALGKTYDFSSSFQARAIITRAGKPQSEQLEINTFSIGEIGFTTGTYEMFSDSSLYVKENSPFDITFIITGNSSYIPAREAYEVYRCYESDTGFYAAGTAEMLAEKYVEMLKGLR